MFGDQPEELEERQTASIKSSEAETVQQKQRCRSQQTTVNLRRKKNLENLYKRRTDDLGNAGNENIGNISGQNEPENQESNFFASQKGTPTKTQDLLSTSGLTSADLDALTQEAEHLSGSDLYDKITYVRRMISNPAVRKLSPGAYIDAIINSTFLNFITHILGTSNDDDLLYQVTWILINIAAGKEHQTAAVVSCGALDVLINKINTKIPVNLKDQILWCIANVIGDGPQLRNIALEKGALEIIYKLLFDPEATLQSIKHNIAWILSNILRPANDPVDEKMIDIIYSMLKKLITDNPNEPNVVYDSIWALFYSLSQNENKHKLIEYGFDDFLIVQLGASEDRIPKSALRALSQLSSGNDEDVQVLLDKDLIQILADVYEKRADSFKPDILIIFGNIALGWMSQRMQLVNHPIFAQVIAKCTSMNSNLQKEALYMVAHILDSKEEGFLRDLVYTHQDILPLFFFSLRTQTQDWLIVQRNLNALETLLTFQEALKMDIALMIEEDGALTSIEEYQINSPPEVYTKTGYIIDKFFSPDEFGQGNLGGNEEAGNNMNGAAGGGNVFDF